jgi:hypothetical protein
MRIKKDPRKGRGKRIPKQHVPPQLSLSVAEDIRRRYKHGASKLYLRALYRISKGQLNRILKGRTFKEPKRVSTAKPTPAN